MLVCDTSGLIALFDADDRHHAAVAEAVEADPGPFVVSPFVLAELDHLMARRVGQGPELSVLEELAGGAWELVAFSRADIATARQVIEAFPEQEIGLVEASVVVLADRYKTQRVLTLDRRHFGVLRSLDSRPFSLVPS